MSAEQVASALNNSNLTNLDLQDTNGFANVFVDYFTSASFDSDMDSESDNENSMEQGNVYKR